MHRPRHIIVHLTAWAPGCEAVAIGSRVRNRTFWSTPPGRALRSVLGRLKLDPTRAEIREDGHGDPAIYGPLPDATPGEPPVHLASLWDGLDLTEARAVLDQLRRPQGQPLPSTQSPSTQQGVAA